MHPPMPLRHPRRHPRLVVTGVAAMFLTLTGCGGSNANTSSTTTGTTTTGPAPLLDPSAQGPTGATGEPVSGGIRCETNESFETHIHPGLAIMLDGRRVTIPANIGILQDKQCLYWLHTHDGRGVLHIESPSATRVFTLGEFFTVWGYPVGSDKLLNLTGPIHVWVNGKPVTGDPADVPLRDHETIVLANTMLNVDELPAVDFSEVG